MKHMIMAALAAAALHVLGASVRPGEWNTNFTDSRAYAEAHNVPLVVVWGNTSCSYCNQLSAVLEDDVVMDWAKDHPIMMVERHEAYQENFEKYSTDHKAAYNWIHTLSDKSKLNGNPQVGVYWKKADGTVVCSTAFSGRKGKMPATTPANNLAGQFANSLDMLVGDYAPASAENPAFVTTDTENDRLEAESTTCTVYVPLKRESGSKASSCILRVAYPLGTGPSITVNWAAGETAKNVAVTMPTAGFQVGKSVSLKLESADGLVLGTSSILMVEKVENSAKNPHWVGEYTYASLPYGEWTMDFDVAKQKVAQMGGKLFVMFGGPLWCPNCVAIEDYVFNTAEFKAWAKSKKLVLVHFDQGQASSPATPEGTPRGRLLTTTVSTKGVSGSSYLSRHGIDPSSSTVKDVIDRVTYLTDYWLAPESTAARLANPVVLLLNDAGTKVDARFQRQSDGYTMDLAENMHRFNDLLTLAGADENEGYRTVTPLTVTVNGSAAKALHVNASKKFYKVSGARAGFGVEATLTLPEGEDATMTLLDGTNELYSAKGTLEYDEPLTEEQTKNLYLRIASFDNAQSTFFGKDTSFGFTLAVKEVEAAAVVPFKSLTKAEQKALNPSLYAKQSAAVPIYKPVGLGGKVLVGTLSVNVTSANKISAKFAGEKTVSFSGTWDGISKVTGDVVTDLVKSGVTLSLVMDAEGGFEAELEDKSESGIWGSGASAAGNRSLYEGAYTVTLVDAEEKSGTAYLTVKTTKQGKATVAGTMPNGTSISASTTLALNEDGTATLAIFKTSAKGTLSVALAVDPNAADTWGEEGEMDTVRSVAGCYAWWTDALKNETQFDVYGGYWEKNSTPLGVCELFDLSDELEAVVDGETVDSVAATKTGFKLNTKNVLTSLSFTKSTGVFSGKAKVLTEAGKSVSATIKGVLLPGWINCSECGEEGVDRPYGSGTLYYKDGKTTVSMPIDLVAEEEP